MRMIPALMIGWVILISSALAVEKQASEPKKILMIGNSLTYTWGIPEILEKFAAETNRELDVTAHVAGGKTLEWHWSNIAKPSGLTAKEAIAKGGYDLIILQEFSNILMKPEGRASFEKIMPEYLKEIGSTPVMLYMAHPTRKEVDLAGIQPIIDSYIQQAKQHHLVSAPAALAFVESNTKLPTLALMDLQTDRKYAQNKVATHSSPYGSYLAACALYAAIYNQSPVGLTFHAAFDNKTEIPIEAADATAAQEIAWKVWQDYQREHPLEKP